MSELRQRTVYHRDKKLRRLARGMPCMVGMRGVCNGNRETVVWAHSNLGEHGKGGSIKSHDCFGFFACASCHYMIDQGKYLTRYRRETWQRDAMTRTRHYMIAEKLVTWPMPETDAMDDQLWLVMWQTGAAHVGQFK